ncbi:hypothetical protein [Muriicola soli]|uniref:Uncharacterized protein n=1 Tax=Muriicola soli TaxID=2507538 RepID=A0A411E805_9FLAO|nr:hypothetical protein [Muriicola soli]QBA63644.1 hypothetical protein EQY75_03220 [Muriicola soli]
MEEVATNHIGLEAFHRESRKWISQLDFTADEITFFNHLLHSYVFEPDTPGLFQTLQKHQREIDLTRTKCVEMKRALLEHENQLSGLMEISSKTLDKAYQQHHLQFKEQMEECMRSFQKLKAEIFAYGQQILKKRHRRG